MTTNSGGQGAISNILAVAGFIILIAIIVWGAFHFLELASSGFSSLFGGGDKIDVALNPDEVKAGEVFEVSWDYSPEAAGVYTVIYQCRENFQLRSVTQTGIVTGVPCGAAFPLGNESTNSARFVASITSIDAVEMLLTVVFTPAVDSTSTTTSATKVQGSATITVHPAEETQAPPTQTPPVTQTPPTSSTPSTPTPSTPTTKPTTSGKPDLSVRIVAMGVIDSYSGAFIPRGSTSGGNVVAVKFDIANNGSAASGAYYFTAQLPTSPQMPYVSNKQASLAPGAHIENTLRFNQVAPGGGMFSVTVDSSGVVNESNESNNTATQWVSDGNYGYPQAQPYYYGY